MSTAESSGRPAQGLHHAVNERMRSVQVQQVLTHPLALVYAEHMAAAILGRDGQVIVARAFDRDALTIGVRGHVAEPPRIGPDADTWSRTAPPAPLEAAASITLSADLLTADRITRACHMVAQLAGLGADR